MNPERLRYPKTRLTHEQADWLSACFFDLDGEHRELCRAHFIELTHTGQGVINHLKEIAKRRLAGESLDAFTEGFVHKRASPPTKTEISCPWMLEQFHMWMKSVTAYDPVKKVYVFACFIPSIYGAHREFLEHLRSHSDKSESQPDTITFVVFRRFLKEYAPDVKLRKLRPDTCNTCFKYTHTADSFAKWRAHFAVPEPTELSRKEAEVAQAKADYDTHVAEAKAQKAHYRDRRAAAKLSALNRRLESRQLGLRLNSRRRRTSDTLIHISVDAQKIMRLPSIGIGDQPGRFYYLQKIKLYNMGVVDEGTGKGICFLWDQVTHGSGGTSGDHVCSAIYHFLQRAYVGDKKLLVTVDNCKVNKSFYVLGFCHHLALLGYFDEVELHFLVEGHTRMAPDRMFGWCSSRLKRTRVCSVEEVAAVLNKRGLRPPTYCAIPLVPGDLFGFKAALEPRYKEVANIAKYYSFLFTRAPRTGIVQVNAKKTSDSSRSVDITSQLVRSLFHEDLQPRPIAPAPLDKKTIKDLRQCAEYFPDSKMPHID